MSFDRDGFYRDIGRRLQLQRKNRGLTQEAFASRIGVPRPSYANVEAGRQRIPVDLLWRAAVVLGISIAVLVPEPKFRKSAIEMPEVSAMVPMIERVTTTSSADAYQDFGQALTTRSREQLPPNVRSIRRIKDRTT